jgi:hypothetical protein
MTYDPSTEYFVCELHTSGPVIKKTIHTKDFPAVEAAFQAAIRKINAHKTK